MVGVTPTDVLRYINRMLGSVVQEIELPYYKKKRTLLNKKLTLKSYSNVSTNNRSSRRSNASLNSRRRKR